MTYAEVVETWHDFYVTAGAAAATLVGLLFVGISLHIRLVAEHPEVRGLARVTLADFFVVLLVSLGMLAPLGEIGAATWLIVVGLTTLRFIAPPALDAVTHKHHQAVGSRLLLARFGASALCCIGITATGLLFSAGRFNDALAVLVIFTLLLLVVAVRNTWDLLVTVAMHRDR